MDFQQTLVLKATFSINMHSVYFIINLLYNIDNKPRNPNCINRNKNIILRFPFLICNRYNSFLQTLETGII